MVTANDQVATAIVLAKASVKQGFTGTGVTHLHGVAALQHAFLAEVVIHQGLNRVNPNVSGNIAFFQLAHQLVDVDAVADLDGDPGQVGVGVVHGVAELQRRHRVPAPLFKHCPGLGRCLIEVAEL